MSYSFSFIRKRPKTGAKTNRSEVLSMERSFRARVSLFRWIFLAKKRCTQACARLVTLSKFMRGLTDRGRSSTNPPNTQPQCPGERNRWRFESSILSWRSLNVANSRRKYQTRKAVNTSIGLASQAWSRFSRLKTLIYAYQPSILSSKCQKKASWK